MSKFIYKQAISKKWELYFKETIFKNKIESDSYRLNIDDGAKPSNFLTLFAFNGKIPIAFIDVNKIKPRRFFCVTYVSPKFRGRGISKDLHHEAIEILKNKYNNFKIEGSVQKDNITAAKALKVLNIYVRINMVKMNTFILSQNR